MAQSLHQWAEAVADQGANSQALATLMRLCNVVVSASTPTSKTGDVRKDIPTTVRHDANQQIPGTTVKAHSGSAEAAVNNALPLCTYILRSEGQVCKSDACAGLYVMLYQVSYSMTSATSAGS